MKIVNLFVFLLFSVTLYAQNIEKTEACPCDYPAIKFLKAAAKLDSVAKAVLEVAAKKLKERPECKLTIKGYSDASKHGQFLCQRRLEIVLRYLHEVVGISSDRLVTNAEVVTGLDYNIVDLKCE